jgi:type IV secretion system protein VirD4
MKHARREAVRRYGCAAAVGVLAVGLEVADKAVEWGGWGWTVRAFVGLSWVAVCWLLLSWSGSERERKVGAFVGFVAVATTWVLFVRNNWAEILPLVDGKRRVWSLGLADDGVFWGLGVGLVATLVALHRANKSDYKFENVELGDFGFVDWMTIEKVSKLFPEQGEIVIGELYRPDLDTSNGGGEFDPKVKATWGRGGKAKLAMFNLNFDSSHMLFFAGSGGFKTTSTVVPTALHYSGSMVVLDPAGEIAALVAERRSNMGGKRNVVVLDPQQKDPKDVVGFNVLGPLLRSDQIEADAVAFAKLLIAESKGGDGGGNADFFKRQSHNLLTGLLLSVLVDEENEGRRTLVTLRELTSMDEKALKAKLKAVVEATFSVFVQQTLSPFIGMAEQTFSGVFSGVTDAVQWLKLDHYAAMVCGGNFKASDLPAGHLDVFLQIPGDMLKAYPGIGRVIIGSLMKAMVQADGGHEKRVLFCLDEVNLLGYMNALEEARDRGRKYGITLMLLYQSLGQIEDAFGKTGAAQWLEGVSLVSYAAIKSMETAEQISKRCGETTIRIESQSTGNSIINSPLSKEAAGKNSASHSLQKRALIFPHEIVQTMRADEQIVMVRGQPPIRIGRAVYFRRDELLAGLGAAKFGGTTKPEAAKGAGVRAVGWVAA